MTDIATATTEQVGSTNDKDESFLYKHRKIISAIVLVIIVICVAMYWTSTVKSHFIVSEVSKKIDEMIKNINEKQKTFFEQRTAQ